MGEEVDIQSDRRFNVLITDDSQDNIDLITTYLQKEKYKTMSTKNGYEALSLLKSNKFDIILLDVMMPEMDGFEVCRQVRNNPATRDIPIIFLTALNDKECIVKGLGLGANDYVAKPFNPPELLARVKTHLDLKNKTEQLKTIKMALEETVAERTAQLVEANRKLSKIEKIKGDFLALISHELRTPLNGITGFVELIGSMEISGEVREYVDYLKQSADRLVQFSESALLITSLSADQLNIHYKKISLKKIIVDAFRQVNESVAAKNITITVDLDPPEDFIVAADPALITRSIVNILVNAVKYSPHGGEIVLRMYRQKNSVFIEIRDDGPGFSKESLDRLFELFFTQDIRHHHLGFGLGLAEANLIMDAHSGKIEVMNHDKKGASVKLVFSADVVAPE